ncbi:oligosaccharide flippase family protein [Candidatus Woesebacteria bacterium]|nr:oligosaccharide flippase family protein [Candidatus Woesebacteria bacterium]
MLKKIASNTLAQLVAKFFGAGLTLLTTYYTIRLAGIDLYGDLTKILVLVAVGFTAIDFGLNAEVIRSSKTDAGMRKNLDRVIVARLLISGAIILFLNLVVSFLPGGYSPAVKSVFWVGSLAILFQGIYTSSNSWFQYQLGYWKSTLSVVFGSLVGTVLTLYFLKNSPTLINFVLANTLGYLVMSLCSLFMLPSWPKLSGSLWPAFSLIRNSLILGLILIASVLASKIDTVILGIFRSSGEVGEYGFAYRIFDVILVLPVFVMNIIYPLSLRESKSSDQPSLMSKTTKVLALIAIPTAILLYALAPSINVVKPGLTIAISVLRVLAISLPLFYVTAPLMWNLIAKKRDKLVLVVYLLATLVNVTLNLIFIPRFGAVVAAINTGFTELFIFLALLYFSRSL